MTVNSTHAAFFHRRRVQASAGFLRDVLLSLNEKAASDQVTGDFWKAQTLRLAKFNLGAAARLGVGGRSEFTADESEELDERLEKIEKAVFAIKDGDDISRIPSGLAALIWNTYVRFERKSAAAAGAKFECRTLGKNCCAGCRATAAFGWKSVGELPDPGDGDCTCLCSCDFSYAGGCCKPTRRPEEADETSPVHMADISCADINAASPYRLKGLSARDATAILGRCPALDDDVTEVLETVAAGGGVSGGAQGVRGVSPGAPASSDSRNPGNSDFSALDEWQNDNGGHWGMLSHLLAVPNPDYDGNEENWDAKRPPHEHPLMQAASQMVYAARLNGADSRRLYTRDGSYLPERKELHDRLAEASLNPAAAITHSPAMQPMAYLVIGNHCCGKSSTGKEFLTPHMPHCTVISSNEMLGGLPEYQGWNAPLLHSEAEAVARRAMDLAIQRRHHLFVEHVGHDADEASAIIDKLADYGYAVHLRHIAVNPQEAATRAASRFLENPFGTVDAGKMPSRYVDPDYIANDVGNRSMATYRTLSKHPAVVSHRNHPSPLSSAP